MDVVKKAVADAVAECLWDERLYSLLVPEDGSSLITEVECQRVGKLNVLINVRVSGQRPRYFLVRTSEPI
jgi:hypothetical protein